MKSIRRLITMYLCFGLLFSSGAVMAQEVTDSGDSKAELTTVTESAWDGMDMTQGGEMTTEGSDNGYIVVSFKSEPTQKYTLYSGYYPYTPNLNEMIYYDESTKTLTLNNLRNLEKLEMVGMEELTINLIGENVISTYEDSSNFWGSSNNITIVGSGSMTIGTEVGYAYNGFTNYGKVTLNSGTINVTSKAFSVGELILNGGTFNSYYGQVACSSLVMNAGTVNMLDYNKPCLKVFSDSLTFNGGQFSAESTCVPAVVKNDQMAQVSMTVSPSATMWVGSYPRIKQRTSAYTNQGYLELSGGNVMVDDIAYQTHVQNVGWQDWRNEGDMSGTSGQGLRLEGIILNTRKLNNVGIRYRTHVENIGWQKWVDGGAVSGTFGRNLRLEAIDIELTGTEAQNYDIYYQVHAQDFGWLGWAKNGESAGTAGYGSRLEGIRVMLVPKGQAVAPASDDVAFHHV